MRNECGGGARRPRGEPPIDGGATPWWLDDVLRSAAAAVTGWALTGIPSAEPRRPPSGARGHYSSALALRIAGSVGLPAEALAADIATELRSSPHVVRAAAEGRGFVSVTLSPRARVSLVRAACDRNYLLGGCRPVGEREPEHPTASTASVGSMGFADTAGFVDLDSRPTGSVDSGSAVSPGEARPDARVRRGAGGADLGGRAAAVWALTPLHEAESVAEARDWAREDARRRMALVVGGGAAPHGARSAPSGSPRRSPRDAPNGAPGGTAIGPERADVAGPGSSAGAPSSLGFVECPGERPGLAGEVTWRDPYLDGPPGDGDASRLLAVVGEANARFAFCRSVPERPRAAEVTGPGLPALPTADEPGNWQRLTAANPAFTVRHAHAHAVSTRSWAADAGVLPPSNSGPGGDTGEGGAREWGGAELGDDAVAALNEPYAAALIGCLFDGPGVLRTSAGRRQPHILVRYLEGVATAYHDWRESCTDVPGTVVNEAARGEVVSARLELCAAVAGVLRTGLSLLGVSAPTRL